MIGRAAKTVLRKSRRQVRPSREVCPLCFEDDHIGGRNHIPAHNPSFVPNAIMPS
jgi:hypothetical protein